MNQIMFLPGFGRSSKMLTDMAKRHALGGHQAIVGVEDYIFKP